ncbi:hypothetical protein [Aeromicrobium sp.]|uniref:hypothetical protein n=1 Tax=Aeromicrobium sp. TaxID=1871063 RepID=UPI0028B0DD23|nr:hypothetical protein [Aeromicrobium sp.]
MGIRNSGRRVNAAVDGLASKVDGQTADVARRAAPVITLAVRLLRWPSLLVLVAAWPFLAGLAVVALVADDTWLKVLAGGLAGLGAVVSAAFALRRHRVLDAVRDEPQFATELGIAVSLSDDVGEARQALGQLAGTTGGVRVFSRLKGLWRGFGVAPGVLESIDDLPRARWFFPPRIGTSVTLSLAALLLVPVSFLACLLLVIAAAAR